MIRQLQDGLAVIDRRVDPVLVDLALLLLALRPAQLDLAVPACGEDTGLCSCSSTTSLPRSSRSPGICSVSTWARMPAVQITVAASMTVPSVSRAESSVSDSIPVSSRTSTPSASSAASISGRGPSPRARPTTSARSSMTTRTGCSPATARRRLGSSVTTSRPVKPPPTTTAVKAPGRCGSWLSCAMCWCRASAASMVSTSNRCSAPGSCGLTRSHHGDRHVLLAPQLGGGAHGSRRRPHAGESRSHDHDLHAPHSFSVSSRRRLASHGN